METREESAVGESPPLLPGKGGGALLAAPTAVATSSGSVFVEWDAATDGCRPRTRWEVQVSRPPPHALHGAAALLSAYRALPPPKPPPPPPPLPPPPPPRMWGRALAARGPSCPGVPRLAGAPAGVASADGLFCCSGQCGQCGGAGCSSRPGGAAECCPGWGAFEAAARVCALSGGAMPCAVQELGSVECPLGFHRPTKSAMVCLRLFGGGDGTPPLAHHAARAFCRTHFDADLAEPRNAAAHKVAVQACDQVLTPSLSSCWLGASSGGCATRYGRRHTGAIMRLARADGLDKCCALCQAPYPYPFPCPHPYPTPNPCS